MRSLLHCVKEPMGLQVKLVPGPGGGQPHVEKPKLSVEENYPDFIDASFSKPLKSRSNYMFLSGIVIINLLLLFYFIFCLWFLAPLIGLSLFCQSCFLKDRYEYNLL